MPKNFFRVRPGFQIGVCLILTLLIFSGCDHLSRSHKESVHFDLPYDLENPEVFELADELHEISGISPVADGKTLLAINDETGILYFLDLRGKIISSKWFHKGGDYEDVAVVGEGAYVMKSNGNLYHIPTLDGDSLKSITHKADLKDGIELESLAADTARKKLVLLVKAGDSKHGKATAYEFDFVNQKFLSGPSMLVDPQTAPGLKLKGKSLRASAMSKNPITGHFYIVASINRMLLICDEQGNALASYKLSKKAFPQPEGICFLPNGDMFISSEGLSKAAKLYRFQFKSSAPATILSDSLTESSK